MVSPVIIKLDDGRVFRYVDTEEMSGAYSDVGVEVIVCPSSVGSRIHMIADDYVDAPYLRWKQIHP